MNFENSWMVNYGSKLRKNARRKRTSIIWICASNLPSLPWNIKSVVHKIGTTLKRKSDLHRNPLSPQSGIIPTFLKAAKTTAAAIFCQNIREWSPFVWRNSSRGQNLGLQCLDDRRAEDILLTLSSSLHTLLTRRFLGAVIRIALGRKIGQVFMYEDWLHCLHRKRFKTRFDIYKKKELNDIRAIRKQLAEMNISSKPMNYVMFHHTRGDTHRKGKYTQITPKKVIHKEVKHYGSWIDDRRKQT